MDTLIAEINMAKSPVMYTRVHDDALISRSRSKALTAFLETDAHVWVQIDHDIMWTPGDVLSLAEKAHERQTMVAGFYSCRAKGKGFSGRLEAEAATLKLGVDVLHPAEYLPGGFVAIPRVVAEEVLLAGKASTDPNMKLTKCIYMDGSGFYDFFRPIVVPTTLKKEGKPLQGAEYLSEDWSYSWRARQANPNRPQYLWAKPVLIHFGEYGFTMMEAGRREPAVNMVKP